MMKDQVGIKGSTGGGAGIGAGGGARRRRAARRRRGRRRICAGRGENRKNYWEARK